MSDGNPAIKIVHSRAKVYSGGYKRIKRLAETNENRKIPENHFSPCTITIGVSPPPFEILMTGSSDVLTNPPACFPA